ncbi:MAG: hypothetical protein WCT99_00680 [Bacteroidota bacterium]|jgi:hypothetical protein
MNLRTFTICLSIFAGCTSLIPLPEKTDMTIVNERWSNSSIDELFSGRNIYITKCSGCHGIKPPASYTANEWDTILVGMIPKAKLTSAEGDLVKKYLYVKSHRFFDGGPK